MQTPKALYILIGIFCVFAIVAGVYAQFIEKTPEEPSVSDDNTNTVIAENDQEIIKSHFSGLFTNTINLNGFDTTGIAKNVQDKEIVYAAYDIMQNEEAYEINIHIPVVNIKNEVANSFNQITQTIFANKATEVLRHTDVNKKIIYSIDYVAYVNGDILSVVIRSTLKDGKSAQRVMIQTYNYNLTTQAQVTLNDLITRKALNKDDVNAKIEEVVKEADAAAKAIQSMGYNTVFSRDLEELENGIYTVDNTKSFFLGDNNRLYIIYPYGNNNFTSEMDIVLFE